MIIFIKKIKTKEGINTLDMDKIKKGIPAGYKASENDPMVSFTANHVVVAFRCQVTGKPKVKAKTGSKGKTKSKKIIVAPV